MEGPDFSMGTERVVECPEIGDPPQSFAKRIMIVAAIGFFPICYFFLISHFAVNIPAWDDYDAILGYLNSPFSQRFSVIAAQHNEHRIAFTRLLSEGILLLNGQIDFGLIVLIGNASLLAIFGFLLKQVKDTRNRDFLYCAISIILFTPATLRSAIWALGASQNNFVHLFALSSGMLFFSGDKIWAMALAIGFATLATFTSAQGLFVLPALLLALVISCRAGTRFLLGNAAVLFSATLVIAAAYFRGYENPVNHPQALDMLRQPVQAGTFFLVFLGNAAWIGGTLYCLVLGILLLLWIVLAFRSGALRNSPVCTGFVMYLFLAAVSAAFFRGHFGLEMAMAERYRINSLLMISTLLVVTADRRFNVLAHKMAISALFALVIYWAANMNAAIADMKTHRDRLTNGLASWTEGLPTLYYPKEQMQKAGIIIQTSLDRGIYKIPDFVSESSASVP